MGSHVNRTFRALMPGDACDNCDNVRPHPPHARFFDLKISQWLTNFGGKAPAELKFIRRSLEMDAKDLGARLLVRSETISKWETGARPIGSRAFLCLNALVKDSLDDTSHHVNRVSWLNRVRDEEEVTISFSVNETSRSGPRWEEWAKFEMATARSTPFPQDWPTSDGALELLSAQCRHCHKYYTNTEFERLNKPPLKVKMANRPPDRWRVCTCGSCLFSDIPRPRI